MNYCEERKIEGLKMPYFEILEDGHVIHRFKNTLDDEIEITNELMAIPEVTLTLPVEYLEYFYCQMEIKIHFRTCVFYGIVVSMETNKVEETLELTIRHILEKWNYRQTPTNKAIKNKPMPEVLDDKDKFLRVAKDINDCKDAFFIGRGIDYAICEEGSLKLKEVSYTHSDAYEAGELKHGTISLIEDDMPVIAIITDEKIKDKTESNVIEVEARNAKIFTITNDDSIKNHHFKYVVEKIDEYFQPILIVPPLQLIGYYTAYERGLDIDKPRNLAKSVTVE